MANESSAEQTGWHGRMRLLISGDMTHKTATPHETVTPHGRDNLSGPQQSGQEQAGPEKPAERGGPKGPEPTRYGDWEVGGVCSDF